MSQEEPNAAEDRSQTSAWPPDDWWPPQMIAVDDGTELSVRSRPGSRRPVLLVHGLASNGLLWRDVAEALATLGHAVAALDLRGHGLSDRPTTGYTTEQAASDVAHVVRSLGWDGRQPLIAGQSWGANVALLCATIGVEFGGILCVDGGWIYLKQRFADFDECWQVLAPPGFGDRSPDAVISQLRTHLAGWPEHSLEAVLGNLEVVNGRVRNRLAHEHHRQILYSLWANDPSNVYPNVTIPVHLMVAGRQASEDVDRASAELVRSTVSWHPGAHHDIHLQQPGAVLDQLLNLLRVVEGSTTS